MTHYQLQTALKALRDNGYDVRVKLNAKTFLLQAEYDRLQEEISAVPAVEEVPEPSVYEIPLETGVLTLITNHQSTEEFINSGILDNCVNVENWDCGDVRTFNTDTLYCELPTRNIAAEYIADNAPDYWATWDTAYTTAIASLTPVTHAPIPVLKSTPINHGEIGIAFCLMCLVAWQLVATLLVPLITQTFYTVRKIAIDTTLIVKGFKQAASLAKKSLQIA